jgi:hypothetical protein
VIDLEARMDFTVANVIGGGLARFPEKRRHILGVVRSNRRPAVDVARRLELLDERAITLGELLEDYDVTEQSACLARVFELTAQELIHARGI